MSRNLRSVTVQMGHALQCGPRRRMTGTAQREKKETYNDDVQNNLECDWRAGASCTYLRSNCERASPAQPAARKRGQPLDNYGVRRLFSRPYAMGDARHLLRVRRRLRIS